MSFRIEKLSNPTRFLVTERCWFFPFIYFPCTWGDGCGHDTGVHVILETEKEAEEYIERELDFKRRFGL